MYKANFLHRSIGISNIMIDYKGSAVLVDYERAYYKNKFEELLKKGGHLNSNYNDLKYYDYYDLELLCSLVISLIKIDTYNEKYLNNNNELHDSLSNLANCKYETLTLNNFFQKIDELYAKFIK